MNIDIFKKVDSICTPQNALPKLTDLYDKHLAFDQFKNVDSGPTAISINHIALTIRKELEKVFDEKNKTFANVINDDDAEFDKQQALLSFSAEQTENTVTGVSSTLLPMVIASAITADLERVYNTRSTEDGFIFGVSHWRELNSFTAEFVSGAHAIQMQQILSETMSHLDRATALLPPLLSEYVSDRRSDDTDRNEDAGLCFRTALFLVLYKSIEVHNQIGNIAVELMEEIDQNRELLDDEYYEDEDDDTVYS